MSNIALTQGLDVQSPLPLIFDKIGDVEAGRSDGLSTRLGRRGKTGTGDSNVGHCTDKK
jgi:hypothetical protein